MRRVLLVSLISMSFACGRSRDSEDPAPTAPSPAPNTDALLIQDSEIEGIPFQLCAQTNEFHPTNALWLSYLSITSYANWEDLSPKLNQLGLTNRQYFTNDPTETWYTYDERSDSTVIAFRGTEFDKALDVLADLNIMQKDYLAWGKVHAGFLAAFEAVEAQLFQRLDVESAKKPLNLWLAGHSQGGALANLFLARLLQHQAEGRYTNIRVLGSYSIGMPMLGNKTFAERLDAEAAAKDIPIFRIRNHADAVTGVPTSPIDPSLYQHSGKLIYIDGDQKLHLTQESLEASDYATAFPVDPYDHETKAYFSPIKAYYQEAVAKGTSLCPIP